MSKRTKIKLELTEANNGYILGIINPNYQNGGTDYYKDTFVGTDIKDLVELMVAQLVANRVEVKL